MFEDVIVVQSAVSAFNNAALQGAAFLWYAFLSLPLFMLVYFCGNSFLERIGWKAKDLKKRFSFVCVLLTLVWMVLFGGNYNVLRDAETVLPFVIAAITFFSSLYIGNYLKTSNLIKWQNLQKKQKYLFVLLIICCLVLIALSDLHAWWGPLLQIGSVLMGLLFGRGIKKEVGPLFALFPVILLTTIALLMQPEFFRFGQLGSLSFLHLAALGFVGFCVSITVALSSVNAKSAMRNSVYVKLKWLARFVTLLCFALFVLTESVPVFIGMLVVVFLSTAMSIWHSNLKTDSLKELMLAVTFMAFGVLMTMPVITSMGVLYWLNLPTNGFWKQFKSLL